MNKERIKCKLKYDDAFGSIVRLLYRTYFQQAKARRLRTRWSAFDESLLDSDWIDSFSLENSKALWAGASDQEWTSSARSLWPELYKSMKIQAENAANGVFDLLGSGAVSVVNSMGNIEWHKDFKANAVFPKKEFYLDIPVLLKVKNSDIKVPWELSRFQHIFYWLWVNPKAYKDAFISQFKDWHRANPIAYGVNWACTMDVALRTISFSAALAAWGEQLSHQDLREVLISLAAHGHFIIENLEWTYPSRTNHYFSNIAGLITLASVLHNYKPAQRWFEIAQKKLEREILIQFAEDGFDKEGSTTYHRLMLELTTIAIRACQICGRQIKTKTLSRINKAFKALQILSDCDGNVPYIGDNDSSRVFPAAKRSDAFVAHLLPIGSKLLDDKSLAIAPCSPEFAIIFGPESLYNYKQSGDIQTELAKNSLPKSGFFVLGDKKNRMIMKAGPLDYSPVGGHRHLDQLSFTLSVNGEYFFIDPGQYTYTADMYFRNKFRLSSSHNTVCVDGQEATRVFTDSGTMFSIVNEDIPKVFEYLEKQLFRGAHKGFRRLDGGGDYIREVKYQNDKMSWLIKDTLAMTGSHRYRWRFNLAPEINYVKKGSSFTLSNGKKKILLDYNKPDESEIKEVQSFFSPAYGVLRETVSLLFELSSEGCTEVVFRISVLD